MTKMRRILTLCVIMYVMVGCTPAQNKQPLEYRDSQKETSISVPSEETVKNIAEEINTTNSFTEEILAENNLANETEIQQEKSPETTESQATESLLVPEQEENNLPIVPAIP